VCCAGVCDACMCWSKTCSKLGWCTLRSSQQCHCSRLLQLGGLRRACTSSNPWQRSMSRLTYLGCMG